MTIRSLRNTASGGWQSMKLSSWNQPAGVSIPATFGSSSGDIDDLLGRVTKLEDQNSAVIATYGYRGVGTAVALDLPEPEVFQHGYGTNGSADYDAYMDIFNRPVKSRWVKDTAGTDPVFVSQEMAWNRVCGVTAVQDNVMKNENTTTPVRMTCPL